jgi:hypothetical protein
MIWIPPLSGGGVSTNSSIILLRVELTAPWRGFSTFMMQHIKVLKNFCTSWEIKHHL